MSNKKKLQQFAEMKTFSNVLEVGHEEVLKQMHPMAGNWRKEVFKNDHKLILELGCGKAEYTLGLSRAYPEINFIGIDIKGARMWRGAKTALDENLKNAFFLRTRIEFIGSFFGQEEVDEIWITFPDPQARLSREKKRLTSPTFLDKYKRFLKPGGVVHLKTDSAFLYDYTLESLTAAKKEILVHSNRIYHDLNTLGFSDTEKEVLKIKTHYEQMFTAQGHEICYLQFKP